MLSSPPGVPGSSNLPAQRPEAASANMDSNGNNVPTSDTCAEGKGGPAEFCDDISQGGNVGDVGTISRCVLGG